VKILLNCRPDLDVVKIDGSGRTVLHNIVLHDSPELTKLFLKHIDPNVATSQLVTPLHEAAVRGSIRSAKILIDAGAKVNQMALQGLTPLHNAASFAQNDILELLVKNNAEVGAASERGLTPIMCAAAMSHSRTIVLLAKLGAEIDAVDALVFKRKEKVCFFRTEKKQKTKNKRASLLCIKLRVLALTALALC
jgi:ankyrin repeat protein